MATTSSRLSWSWRSWRWNGRHSEGRPDSHICAAVLLCLTSRDELTNGVVNEMLSSFNDPECLDPWVVHFRTNRTYDGNTRIQYRVHERAPDIITEAFDLLTEYLNEHATRKYGPAPRSQRERRLFLRQLGF